MVRHEIPQTFQIFRVHRSVGYRLKVGEDTRMSPVNNKLTVVSG